MGEMNPDTLKALKESIAHWARNLEAPFEEVHIRSSSCALCLRFNSSTTFPCVASDGERCPVMLETGRQGCSGTPWLEACYALEVWETEIRRKNNVLSVSVLDSKETKFREKAEKMYSFLSGLLPTTSQKA